MKIKVLAKLLTALCFINQVYSQCATNRRYLDPVFQQVNITTGIKFGEANPYNPLVSNQELFFDIYQPAGDTAQARPLIVHAFGGGFFSGNRTGDDIPYWGSEYAKRGFVFVSVDYRTGYNPVDQGSTLRAAYRCAQDINAALRYLADNTQLYRLDLDNFYLTGNSAGSIGGLITVFMDDNDRPQATFGTFFEPSDLGCMNCSGNNNFNNQKVPVKAHINLWGAVYDTAYIDVQGNPDDNVPVISFHGTADAVVPFGTGTPYGLPIFPTVFGSSPMHVRLQNQGIRNELVALPGLPHEPEAQFPWVSDTIISKATKFIYPIVYGDSARISGDFTVCKDSSKVFFADLHAGSTYCWTVPTGTIIQHNLNEVEVQFNSTGNHLLILTETNKLGMTKIDSMWVDVQLPPQSGLSYNANDGLVQFSLTNTNINQAQWQFGDGNSSSQLSPSHQYLDTGIIDIQVRITDNYCSADTSFSILPNKCPISGITYTVVDSFIFLYNNSLLADSVFWVTEGANIFTGDTLVYQVSNNGQYPFILYSFNRYCMDTAMLNLDVLLCAKSDFSYQTNGLNVTFINESFNGYFYFWNFGNGLVSGMENPASQQYPDYGTYTVELITYNIDGCSDTLSKLIEINAPNNIANDGLSPTIKVYPVPADHIINFQPDFSFSKSEISIYDMTGRLVAKESNSISIDISKNALTSGVYSYKILLDAMLYTGKVVVK